MPIGRPFQKGQSGNPKGRPKGARARFGEYFVEALAEDFEQHGASVIERVRKDDPSTYLRVCTAVLPKELNVRREPLDELTDEQLDEHIRRLAAALGEEIRASESAPAQEAETRH